MILIHDISSMSQPNPFVCLFVAYGAKNLPHVGPSRQLSFNLQKLCPDSAGETQQKQGNAVHCASHAAETAVLKALQPRTKC